MVGLSHVTIPMAGNGPGPKSSKCKKLVVSIRGKKKFFKLKGVVARQVNSSYLPYWGKGLVLLNIIWPKL